MFLEREEEEDVCNAEATGYWEVGGFAEEFTEKL